MRLKPGVQKTNTDSGPMIMAYVKGGYLDRKPTQRADYTDYRLLKKPAQLMGHTLVLVEEEYKTEHLGCCVSYGMGATVKVVGSTDQLEKFAEKNACSFTPHVDLATELKSVGVNAQLANADYATISCRERDRAKRRGM